MRPLRIPLFTPQCGVKAGDTFAIRRPEEAVIDMGAAMNAALIVIGDKLDRGTSMILCVSNHSPMRNT
jgi:hypothetical protein